jgi:hypothetical protein
VPKPNGGGPPVTAAQCVEFALRVQSYFDAAPLQRLQIDLMGGFAETRGSVRYGRPTNVVASFDHFVGTGEQRRRHVQAKCLEVDDKLIFGRCMHREIGRLRALQDAIDIVSRTFESTAVSGPKEARPPLEG